MGESFRAFCSDFYVNQKLGVKLELPQGREPVLELFERLRREYDVLDRFRRYEDELALETAEGTPHRWVAVRANNIRSGVVNPEDVEQAYGLHRKVLEVAPYFLSISPLDIEFIEMLFGFDLECRHAHDRVIHHALIAPTPLGELMESEDVEPIDCQPTLGFALGENREHEVHVEVRSRGAMTERGEPISVYLTVRRLGPFKDLESLAKVTDDLAERGERLVAECVVPKLLKPIREAIGLAGA